MRSLMRVLGLLVLVLAGTEVGLRLAGRLFYFLSSSAPPPLAAKSTILCVGESTTFGL
jgi:hypothetical protein